MSTHQRLLSLDVLRGITVAGMILVNNAGACGYGYAPLRHAKWDGFTPADLVFPMFMFLMGISTYISLRKYNFRWQLTIGKIIKRAFLLILIGIAMKWLIHSFETGIWNDWEHMRILGVMQRLGICYGITAVMALFIPHTVLGTSHMYLQGRQFVEPEGILSTISAVAQVMIGFVCGHMLINRKDNQERMQQLFFMGTLLLFAGFLLSYACPLNKRLWSPSFVLVTCGIAALALAVLIEVIDVRKKKEWCTFFKVFGVNCCYM